MVIVNLNGLNAFLTNYQTSVHKMWLNLKKNSTYTNNTTTKKSAKNAESDDKKKKKKQANDSENDTKTEDKPQMMKPN